MTAKINIKKGMSEFAILLLVLSPTAAYAASSTLKVTATVAPQPVTISTEDMIAYCYAHGLEMAECVIEPEHFQSWMKSK